jgi:transcription-repair coupling factor (superfamily II helicase)
MTRAKTPGGASFGATLGDRLGAPLELSPRAKPPWTYDPPEGVPVLRAAELATRALDPKGARLTAVRGAFGSAAGLVAATLAKRGARVVLVTADADGARAAARDAASFLGSDGLDAGDGDDPTDMVHVLAPAESSPWSEVGPDRRGAQLRMATLTHLASGRPWSVLAMPATALARRVVAPADVRARTAQIEVPSQIDQEDLVRRLAACGYVRAPIVEDPGTFAVRGGLVDVWPASSSDPVRIELDGDIVMSLKTFDPELQRTRAPIPSLLIGPAREAPTTPDAAERARERVRALCDAVDLPSAKTRALTEDVASGRSFFGADGYLPAFTELVSIDAYFSSEVVFVLDDPPSLTRALRDELDRADVDVQRKAGLPHFPREAFFVDEEEVTANIDSARIVTLHRTATAGAPDAPSTLERFENAPEDAPTLHTFDQGDLARAIHAARGSKGRQASLDPLLDRIELFGEHALRTAIVARTSTQAERIATLLSHRGVDVELDLEGRAGLLALPAPERTAHTSVHVVVGTLAHGLLAPSERLALITEEEVFGSRAQRRATRDGTTRAKPGRAFVEDLKNLAVGDYVVHVDHGVGKYLGLVPRDVGGARVELLAVEYHGGDKLYLPVWRLNQIQKFAGSDGAPKLDRLGGQTFAKTKAKAEKQVRQMADELLRTYAERRAAARPPMDSPDDDYRACEATFPFEETPDQARAIGDVEGDLARPTPMDRLVCGDVGFGKTEVAIRAAFRVATQGKQVAVLCPTTVLAQQHFLNFSSRFAPYPLIVKALSRFESKGEQDATIRDLKAGKVDVVIGTHRLLSKDVHFSRLGLLVVDEEQRFGVTHKERIKSLKTSVDVLTLTATPIPRTLQMAVTGLRDMSVITTPPSDRRAVRTIVTRPDDEVVREAIRRELSRGGQVFVVGARVEGLYERANQLQHLVPEARIVVAHGQMTEAALENAMIDFVEGRFDLLCSTSIVESGLDIPRANTMIIDRADRFGLAQLYQLRGRVGRAKERAYCYLVVPPVNQMTDESRARIEALERHSEIGSGFQIASLDLELRGAGDLLGADQSGTVATVGFELFCQMLDDAVHELRGETVVHEVEPELSFDVESVLPSEYVDDVGVRLSLYKRLASASTVDDVDDVATEMADRFGQAPTPARDLVHMMRLKVELRKLRALGCEASARAVTLHLREDTPLDVPKLLGLVQQKRSPYKLTPDMRLSRRFEVDADGRGVVHARGGPPKNGLDAVEVVLGELAGCWKAA